MIVNPLMWKNGLDDNKDYGMFLVLENVYMASRIILENV